MWVRVSRRVRMEAVREDAPVTPLELFFDLVFVFALTRVTAFIAEDLTWHGLVRGLLIFALLWWGWICYGWLTNLVRADEGVTRLAMFAAMAAMLVLALAIPEAFTDRPGGLPGPLVVAVCYFVFRALHVALFWIVSREDAGLRRQLTRFLFSVIGATVLLLVASLFGGLVQTALWAGAVVADYGGTLVGGTAGWRLRSPSHFVERYGLILIIALGESIAAIGVGMAGLPISWPIVAAAVLGLVLAAALWWAYFDVTSLLAARTLSALPSGERPRLAHYGYTYLHLPLIAGVLLAALGLKQVLAYVGDTAHHHLADPLAGIGLYALYGGVALYLLAHVAFKRYMMRLLNLPRVVVAATLLVLILCATRLPALAALAMLTAVMVGLVAFETVRLAADRDRIRHEDPPHGSTGQVR